MIFFYLIITQKCRFEYLEKLCEDLEKRRNAKKKIANKKYSSGHALPHIQFAQAYSYIK